MRRLIRDCHEPEGAKKAHRRRAWQLFRALVDRHIVEFVPETEEGSTLRVNVDLQDDFSMDQALSLYLLETIPLLDPDSPDYALDLLTLVESILENPEIILRRQLDRIKDRAVAQMKADGMEYEQRMEELEKLEYPKPLRDFVYKTFNAFADRHPWVGEENIRPKSIAREMFEQFRSFAEYVLDYDLQRSEGLLLRHLNSVYKVLSQTVPDGVKTDEVLEMEMYLRTLLRQVDSSLADEWERMRDPDYQPLGGGRLARDGPAAAGRGGGGAATSRATRRPSPPPSGRASSRSCGRGPSGDAGAALGALDVPDDADGEAWTRGAAARGVRRLSRRARAPAPRPRGAEPAAHLRRRRRTTGEAWRVQQMLVDPEMNNDWVAEFEVDLAASREADEPVMRLLRLGSLA